MIFMAAQQKEWGQIETMVERISECVSEDALFAHSGRIGSISPNLGGSG